MIPSASSVQIDLRSLMLSSGLSGSVSRFAP